MENEVNAARSKPADEFTVEDCMALYEQKGYAAIINNGKLEGFFIEKPQRKDNRLLFIWLNGQET